MTEPRTSWFDDASETPIIDRYVQQMDSFVAAMADGHIDESELREQEARLVSQMKEVEPLLDDGLHAKITRLLCELTAYDLMQTLYTLHQARPTTRFRG